MDGFVDRSYGIYVVKIVGLFVNLFEWVVDILYMLENGDNGYYIVLVEIGEKIKIVK